MTVSLLVVWKEHWPLIAGLAAGAAALAAVLLAGLWGPSDALGMAGLGWAVAVTAVAIGLGVQLQRDSSISLRRERRLVATASALREASARLERMAREDALTGVPNRRAADERLAMECARARRYGRPLSVLMVDVDHFKQINDGHGHAFGDGVLAEVARALTSNVRTADQVARYGGEEFVVTLPETSVEDAAIVAEKLRAVVAGLADAVAGARRPHVTVSIGVAGLDNALDKDVASVVARADGALYAAKRAGRDRVEVSLGSDAQPANDAGSVDERLTA